MFKPRPKQADILTYRHGKMGISAVPGSGKTQTLSYLAANLITQGCLEEDQEILIVTLANSAVDNFSQRIGTFIEQKGLLPHLGYRVRTLHGLAHDIVRENPSIVALDEHFQIIDERISGQIIDDAVHAWLRGHPNALEDYLKPELDEHYRQWLSRNRFPEIIHRLAVSFIRYAKNLQFTSEQMKQRLEELSLPLPLAQLGCELYADYTRALSYQGAVDFDDLIRLALQALQTDARLVERLHYLWPYILEDEAQDSSLLQEEIIQTLVGKNGNWVRVGDPNQAIYETFTTAKPKYFRDFINRRDVVARDLPNSGRSTQSIITLANHLIEWSRTAHPILNASNESLKAAMSEDESWSDYVLQEPYILPTAADDPQPNPPDNPAAIRLIKRKFTPDKELEEVANSLARWLPEHPQSTVAVLVPRNTRGYELSEVLKARKIEYVEMLQSSNATRMAANILAILMAYLADPISPRKLAEVYKAWKQNSLAASPADVKVSAHSGADKVFNLLAHCKQVEAYLWPTPEDDWLTSLSLGPDDAELGVELNEFRVLVQRWQGTTLLPIDQLVLTLAQDLFIDPTDLAIAHKLAAVLRQNEEAHPDWRLPQMSEEISVIAHNKRRFLGFSEDDTGFDPDRYRGKVLISTIHKAKGLEWDRVYLLSANTYDFPSAMEYDSFISEKDYFRDRLNLEAEALEQIELLNGKDAYAWYEEGKSSRKARLEYTSERLRLLYVGITRARKELIITWNTGRNGEQQPALPFVELQSFWEEKQP